MTKFIDLVIQDLISKQENISNLKFVFPSRRASVFLKKSLAKYIDKPIFSPNSQSIDEFVEDLSGLRLISPENLYIEFYEVYKENTPLNQIESFDSVLGWVNILLNDFNEIDRYLIEPSKLFLYLHDIKETEHWAFGQDKTEQIKAYLNFWSLLPKYYQGLNERLKTEGTAYPGSLYREAVENLEYYIDSVSEKNVKHIFVGFNALNKAEERIIQELLDRELAEIYWDIEETFLQNRNHDAGLFIRNYKNNWRYNQKEAKFKWKSKSYQVPKTINVTGVPKQIGEIKYVGQVIQDLIKNNESLEDTAIVLADETLLLPLLNSLPVEIGPINITMGVPLSTMPISDLFELLLNIQKQHNGKVYHRFVKQVISHPLIIQLFDDKILFKAIEAINNSNSMHLTLDEITETIEAENELLKLLFQRWEGSIKEGIDRFQKLIMLIRENILKSSINDNITLECLFRFHTIFNKTQTLISPTGSLNNLKSLIGLYRELMSKETLDLKGEPLQGLQIMGMLESRVLDFKNVIIVSVNEGLLPAGKSDNSFIPYDVKLSHGLPTFKEKDAVYTYHFYHLLYRAQNIQIIYNTEVDALKGGEKSRFISQLEFEGIHNIKHEIISHKTPAYPKILREIKKTKSVLESLEEIAKKGFSPSSLTAYIRNPLDFYYEKVLNISEFEDVEETMAANTMGTVIHNSLEELYTPYLEKTLKEEDLDHMMSRISETVMKHYQLNYSKAKQLFGKNLIIYEICKRYISNFLNKEKLDIKKGAAIQLVALEKRVETLLDITGLDFPIKIKGYIDRIDIRNGIKRIIDYKTGKVLPNQLHVKNWDDLNTDYKYSKSFQVLCYSLLVQSTLDIQQMEAGIISFKNLSGDYFMKFAKVDENKPSNKNYLITHEILDEFQIQLENLISEILNPDIDFKEKEV